jgi:hypothetical protein
MNLRALHSQLNKPLVHMLHFQYATTTHSPPPLRLPASPNIHSSEINAPTATQYHELTHFYHSHPYATAYAPYPPP